jgi:hypothetical protein
MKGAYREVGWQKGANEETLSTRACVRDSNHLGREVVARRMGSEVRKSNMRAPEDPQGTILPISTSKSAKSLRWDARLAGESQWFLCLGIGFALTMCGLGGFTGRSRDFFRFNRFFIICRLFFGLNTVRLLDLFDTHLRPLTKPIEQG